MANDVTGRVWTLDTAHATNKVWSGMIHADHFEFVGYANDTDTCQLKDSAGRVVWEANGAADLQEVRSGKVGWIDGLVLAAKTAGYVRVYIK